MDQDGVWCDGVGGGSDEAVVGCVGGVETGKVRVEDDEDRACLAYLAGLGRFKPWNGLPVDAELISLDRTLWTGAGMSNNSV